MADEYNNAARREMSLGDIIASEDDDVFERAPDEELVQFLSPEQRTGKFAFGSDPRQMEPQNEAQPFGGFSMQDATARQKQLPPLLVDGADNPYEDNFAAYSSQHTSKHRSATMGKITRANIVKSTS